MPNTSGLKSYAPNEDRAKENGQKGGRETARRRKKRKELAETIKLMLAETLPNGMSRQDAIVMGCLQRLFKEGRMSDLKILAGLIGEDVIKVDVNGMPAPIEVSSEAVADKLKEILNQ